MKECAYPRRPLRAKNKLLGYSREVVAYRYYSSINSKKKIVIVLHCNRTLDQHQHQTFHNIRRKIAVLRTTITTVVMLYTALYCTTVYYCCYTLWYYYCHQQQLLPRRPCGNPSPIASNAQAVIWKSHLRCSRQAACAP